MRVNSRAALGEGQAQQLNHCDLVGLLKKESRKEEVGLRAISTFRQVTQAMSDIRHYLSANTAGNSGLKRIPMQEGNLDICLPWQVEQRLSTKMREPDHENGTGLKGGKPLKMARETRQRVSQGAHKSRERLSSPAVDVRSTFVCKFNNSFSKKDHKDGPRKLLNLYPVGLRVFHVEDFRESVIQMTELFLYIFLARHASSGMSLLDYRRLLKSAIYTLVVLQTASLHGDGQSDLEQDFAKYYCTVFSAKTIESVDAQLPAEPVWINDLPKKLFSGLIQRSMLMAMRRSKRDLSYVISMQNTKNAWPALGETRWWKALCGHKENLCSPVSYPLLDKEVRDSLEEASHENLGRFLLDCDPDFICPTPSSSLQLSREKGGCAANYPRMSERIRPRATAFEVECRRFRSILSESALISELLEERKVDLLLDDFDDWRQRTLDLGTARAQGCLDENSQYYEPYLNYHCCKVVAVEKPAGVRVVTIHDAWMAGAIQSCQKQLLSAWKMNPKSTMQDGVAENINKILRHTKSHEERDLWNAKQPDDSWVWISGDYKDATDLLFMECTNIAFSALQPYGLLNFDLGLKSLEPLDVCYPAKDAYPKRLKLTKKKSSKGECLKQTRGQMMGHWLSFPLLCTINCATIIQTSKVWISQSKDIWENEARRRAAAVILENYLVNGDDILFRCPKSFYQVWLTQVGRFGFKVSMGKNYQSDDFVMINSRYFSMKKGEMVEFGYLNLRLVYGKAKSLDTDGSGGIPTPDMIGAAITKMVQLCPWSIGCIPHAMRISRELFPVGTRFEPNWFVPAHLGGNSVDISMARGGLYLTAGQRKVGAWMVNNPLRASLFCSKTSSKIRSPKVLKILDRFVDVFMLPSEKLEILGDPVFLECHRIATVLDILDGQEPIMLQPHEQSDSYEERLEFSTSCEEQLNTWSNKALCILRAMQEKIKIEIPEKMVRSAIYQSAHGYTWFDGLSTEGFARYWYPNWHCFAKPGIRPTSILRGQRRSYRDRKDFQESVKFYLEKPRSEKFFRSWGEREVIGPRLDKPFGDCLEKKSPFHVMNGRYQDNYSMIAENWFWVDPDLTDVANWDYDYKHLQERDQNDFL